MVVASSHLVKLIVVCDDGGSEADVCLKRSKSVCIKKHGVFVARDGGETLGNVTTAPASPAVEVGKAHTVTCGARDSLIIGDATAAVDGYPVVDGRSSTGDRIEIIVPEAPDSKLPLMMRLVAAVAGRMVTRASNGKMARFIMYF